MHPLNRPFQAETYKRIIESPAKYVIVQAPTGSGKTAYAGQSVADGLKTLYLCKTKSLQDQAAEGYGFTVLKGKNAYKCGEWPAFGADECPNCSHRIKSNGKCAQCGEYATGIEMCPQCGDTFCDYTIAKNRFMIAPAMCLNYSKYLIDPSIHEIDPMIAFLDEAHQLEDIALDRAGLTWYWSNKRLMNYCEPIDLDSNLLIQPIAMSRALVWLERLQKELAKNEPRKPSTPHDKEARWYRNWWEEAVDKVKTVLEMMTMQPDCFFIHADEWGITIRPLTARFHFVSMFQAIAPKIVLMSATIPGAKVKGELPDGLYDLDVSLFAGSLGLNNYEAFKVPNAYPGPLRPVHNLPAPRMGYKSTIEEKADHARLIADKLNGLPQHWTGLVHTTSKRMARELGGALEEMTGRTVWVPEDSGGTEKTVREFEAFCANVPGGIGVAWNMHEGVDGKWINIVITAKTPFPDFSSPYDKARFEYDRAMGLARVANVIEQQQGRNRRGYAEHYGAQAEKYNALADGRWTQVRNYLSDDFIESVLG